MRAEFGGYKNATARANNEMPCDFEGWLVDCLPYLSWAGMVAVFLIYVITHGAGVSSVLTLVFFAALALNTG